VCARRTAHVRLTLLGSFGKKGRFPQSLIVPFGEGLQVKIDLDEITSNGPVRHSCPYDLFA
jgi:hypothetical protein